MPRLWHVPEARGREHSSSVLFYSDGLVEAHDSRREMFGFPRLQKLVGAHRSGGPSMVGFLLSELERFTGEGREQEDDINHACCVREIGGAVMTPTSGVRLLIPL